MCELRVYARLCITGEQSTEVAHLDANHDASIVLVLGDCVRWGPEYPQSEASNMHDLSGGNSERLVHAKPGDLGGEWLEIRLTSLCYQYALHPRGANETLEPARVIVVCVSEDDSVQTADSCPSERFAKKYRLLAGVDQHRASAIGDENRVPLSDIEYDDPRAAACGQTGQRQDERTHCGKRYPARDSGSCRPRPPYPGRPRCQHRERTCSGRDGTDRGDTTRHAREDTGDERNQIQKACCAAQEKAA